MSQPSINLQTFGEEHFGTASLGDKRRTHSLVDLANRLARHPGGTLPEKLKDPLALRRCYDLMKATPVTHERILQPHVQRTLRVLVEDPGVVLVLLDLTELDYSGLTSLHNQLGQIGNGFGRGYECLNSLAVRPEDRTVVGLLHQILHRRPHVPKEETTAQRRARESRESLLWLRAVEGVEQASQHCCRSLGLQTLPAELVLVDVADRGSDTFEFLDHEEHRGRPFVLRSQHNRTILIGHEGKRVAATLHDYLRTLPAKARRRLSIAARDGRPARQTKVCVAWAAVDIQVPKHQRGQYRQESLKVWALRVWEPEPPADGEAVEWFLLTNLPVTTVVQAWEKVDWYCCRWVIEELHKCQKTGCAIESPQFTKAERLQPMIALLSVVAVLLLNLRNLSREPDGPDRLATELLDEEYVAVLSGWRYREQRPLSVREFFLALARLGGHQNRRGDGQPGWLVLWRGWSALQLMVEGAQAIRQPKSAECLDPPCETSAANSG